MVEKRYFRVLNVCSCVFQTSFSTESEEIWRDTVIIIQKTWKWPYKQWNLEQWTPIKLLDIFMYLVVLLLIEFIKNSETYVEYSIWDYICITYSRIWIARANVNFFYIKFEKVIFELFLILTKKERKFFLLRVCDCVNEELFMNKSCFLQPNYNTWFYTI